MVTFTVKYCKVYFLLSLTPRPDYGTTSFYHFTLPHPITAKSFFVFCCMYRVSCTVSYPDLQMYKIYINNILYNHISFAATKEPTSTFNVYGSVHRKYIPIYIQQDAI